MMIEKKNLNQALFREVENPQTSVEKVRALIDAGADINVVGENGRTALMFAAEKRRSEIVELLLKMGVDVNAEDRAEYRALDYADAHRYENESFGNQDMIKLLKIKGKASMGKRYIGSNIALQPTPSIAS